MTCADQHFAREQAHYEAPGNIEAGAKQAGMTLADFRRLPAYERAEFIRAAVPLPID